MSETQFTFHAVLEKSVTEPRMVKGFASVNSLDRSKDLIPPESFDLARFSNNPQLLYNHSFWHTDAGNEIPIGSVTEVTVAKVLNSAEDAKRFIVATEDGLHLDSISKSRNPDVSHGSRGLWVKARVDIDDVWDMVEEGKLNTFSWRGLTSVAEAVIGDMTEIVAKYIDLWECSLVFVPDQFAAMFEIAKSVKTGSDLVKFVDSDGDEKLPVQRVTFSLEVFNTESVTEWLSQKGLKVTDFEEIDGELVSTQRDIEDFQKDALFSIQIATGVTAFVGCILPDDKRKMKETEKMSLNDSERSSTVEKTLKEQSGSKDMAAKAKTDEVVKDEEQTEMVVPEKEETTSTEETVKAKETPDVAQMVESAKGAVAERLASMEKEKYVRMQQVFKALAAFDDAVWDAPNEAEDLQTLVAELQTILGNVSIKSAEEGGENIVKSVAEAVTAAVKAEMDDTLNVIKSLPEILTKFSEQLADKAKSVEENKEDETKTEDVTKSAEAQSDTQKTLNRLEEALASMTGQVKDIQKTAVAPSQSEDGVETTKTAAKDDDPNAVFGGPGWMFGDM